MAKDGFIADAKKHIEAIRRQKFAIYSPADRRPKPTKKSNPLTADLHNAVQNLSAELYAKDVHFLMELIQNAEDNEYPIGVDPSIEFIITSKDITGTGAPATLLVFNNEIGFSKINMESLCSVGLSTKKGRRRQGFIGEKGIGFKSTFLVSKHPYIFSNGYQIRFSDEPELDSGIGYIVPEWVEDKPTTGDLQSVYGLEKELPTTVIILPLRREKVKGVREQLSDVHPELLLFLSNIRRLSVKEKDETLCSISISGRTNLVSWKDAPRAVSWHVELSSHEERESKCSYYIWRQVFLVKPESKVEARKDVYVWNISLAFPLDERLQKGSTCGGIYAFLPTNMVTNFPFIIQSDFLLASSRETILLDNVWNLGILSCVGPCFVSAFDSYVKSHSSIEGTKMFNFLPVRASSFSILNDVRKDIKSLLMEKEMIPCENFCGEDERIEYCKPSQVVRVVPRFRDILSKAKEQGLPLRNFSSQGMFVLQSYLDRKEFEGVMEFLEVSGPDKETDWYKKCMQSCNLGSKLSDETYVDLLCFIMDHVKKARGPSFEPPDIPLRYMKRDQNGEKTMVVTFTKVCYAGGSLNEWFEKWSRPFGFPSRGFLLIPDETHTALDKHERGNEIKKWLSSVNRLKVIDMNTFLGLISWTDAVQIAHFLYHTYNNKLVDENAMRICKTKLPILDSRGVFHGSVVGTLLPSSCSKWGKLFNRVNPFIGQGFIDLSEVYANERKSMGFHAPKNSVLDFLIKFTGAMDIPQLQPPNIEIPIMNSNLKSDQVLLLLDWVAQIKSRNHGLAPWRFERSIKRGKWMKTINSGFHSPENCFLANGKHSSLVLELTQNIPGFAVIDDKFYEGKIAPYCNLLKSFGVTLASEDLSLDLITKHITSLVQTRNVTRETFLSFLKLLKYLNKQNYRFLENQLATFRSKDWLVTSQGFQPPSISYFTESDKNAIWEMTNLPILDESYYGDQIGGYKPELKFLGVVVDMEEIYKIIPSRIKNCMYVSKMSKESAFLLLNCVKNLGDSDMLLLDMIRYTGWLKTKMGYKYPHECILCESEWGPLKEFSEKIPFVDETFYEEIIYSYKSELEAIGVAVDLEYAEKKITASFESMITSPSGPTCEEFFMLLKYIKFVSERMPSVLFELGSCFAEVAFIKTRQGLKLPRESLLFDTDWDSIRTYADLPIIDESFYGTDIHSYRDELEVLGVVVDFSKGVRFVVKGLTLPKEPPSFFSSKATLMIIQCASLLLNPSNNNNNNSLSDLFLKEVRESKWLKTRGGYKSPIECVLIKKSWNLDLESLMDGTFIDHEFYGESIFSNESELKAMGVIVDANDVCSYVYDYIFAHRDCDVMEVYEFLRKLRWKPSNQELNSGKIKLWVPRGDGKWVPPNQCALRDRENLFGSNNRSVYFLDKYYNEELLEYLSFAFHITEYPCMDEYLSLWNIWESIEHHELNPRECCLFWEYMVANWHGHEGLVKERISMVPCTSIPGGTIRLVRKEESANADAIELVNMLSCVNEEEPFFVWYPLEDASSLPLEKLFEIYEFLGVKKLSEMVKSSVPCQISNLGQENLELKKRLIKPGLLKIILGFLSGPRVAMSLKERHEACSSLVSVTVCESDKPIVVDLVLEFDASEKRYYAKGSRVVLLDKASRTLLVHKGSYETKSMSIEFVTYFARAISRLLPLNPSSLNNELLCHLIEKGIMFGFEEEAVKFILKTENLRVFKEDEDFISRVFSVDKVPVSPPPLRRSRRRIVNSPPGISNKKQKSN